MNAQPAMNNYKYHCIATNSCGNVYSSTATLYVTAPATPSVSIAVTMDTICAGNVATFTATSINGGSTPVYQWKKNGINIATGNTYSAADIADGDVIMCMLTSNSNCTTTKTITSNAITMKVNAILTPSIHISASSNNICSGTPVKFSSSVINDGATPYLQWQKNGINTGTNSPAYLNSTFKDGDVITCKFASAYSCLNADTIISNSIIMNVMPLLPPSVIITSSKTSICPGNEVTFNATSVNNGASPIYQWTKNGVAVGFNNSSYTDSFLSNGDLINCSVTSDAACLASPSAVSNSIVIAVFQNPIITLDKTSTLCSGARRQLEAGNFDSYFGNVIYYSFLVYNRWGQKVFESKDLSKGWDGTFGGENRDADVFVWICSYQFAGGNIETKKGTVMLVRSIRTKPGHIATIAFTMVGAGSKWIPAHYVE